MTDVLTVWYTVTALAFILTAVAYIIERIKHRNGETL